MKAFRVVVDGGQPVAVVFGPWVPKIGVKDFIYYKVEKVCYNSRPETFSEQDLDELLSGNTQKRHMLDKQGVVNQLFKPDYKYTSEL